jgi:hypothetical protein
MDSIHKPGKRELLFFFIGQTVIQVKECRIVALHRNHRSHGNIIAWSNRYLYEDTMRDYGNSYITYDLVLSDVLPRKGFPIVFHGVKGNEQNAKWSPSYFNIIEASIVRDYCVKLIEDRERKICKNGALFGSTCSYYCFPLHRPRGDWCCCTLQDSSQGHSGVTEGGKVIRYFCGLSRAVPGTGSEWIMN